MTALRDDPLLARWPRPLRDARRSHPAAAAHRERDSATARALAAYLADRPAAPLVDVRL